MLPAPPATQPAASPSAISQYQIASRLGLSQATVSMALAGNPRVSARTRESVRRVCEEMGYHPNPGFHALGRYRSKSESPTPWPTIAWLHNQASGEWWRRSAVFNVLFEAVTAQAKRLGYLVENLWLPPGEMSPAEASMALERRGIHSLIVLPSFGCAPPLELDWSKFTTVILGDLGQSSGAHHFVGADVYLAMRQSLTEVLGRGYVRPGLITTQQMERLTMQQHTAAYLKQQDLLAAKDWPPIFYADQAHRQDIVQWITTHGVDVVVSAYISQKLKAILEALADVARGRKKGHSPALGLAMSCRPDFGSHMFPIPDLTGVEENFTSLGRCAVDLLVSLTENFERGIPATPIRHLLRGCWHEGQTLRPR